MMKLPKSLPLSALGIAAMVAILATFGGSVGVTQEEPEDVCAVVFEPEEEWSAQAYAYCDVYCVQLDCAGAPAEEDVETCLALLDQYDEATGGGIPPCEPQP